jgi:non-ribosomal peptide synthetase component F
MTTNTIQTQTAASFIKAIPSASDVALPVELELWSNRLARLLMSLGAREGAPVAMALTASVESMVSRSAIAKTGATVVQIDSAGANAGIDSVAGQAIKVGVTTKARRAALSNDIDWLLLDDLSTMRRYMTSSDAPVTAAERAQAA